MTSLKLALAIIIGKIINFLVKTTSGGGTAAPGLIALKIDPLLVQKLSIQLKKNILVTGTNGKTTTTRMISQILNQAGLKHLHNRSGSNLLRGIASTLIANCSLFGEFPADFLGLWETDEAAFSEVCRNVKPQIVLITNLFRDQLDRYGEIDTLTQKWQKALKEQPKESVVLLNSDDAAIASLGKSLRQKVIYFGLGDKNLATNMPDHASDATVCPYCFSELKYEACFVSHMGIYSCPKCGQIQPSPQIKLTKFYPESSKVEIKILGGVSFKINLPGNYNLYNFTAACAAASALKVKAEIIAKALAKFRPAFGRLEKIKIGEKILNILLVKNPTGFNEAINTLILTQDFKNQPGLACLIAINDLIADGTDVSWLWDVNFEKLAPHLKRVIVSGIRAYDMGLRLKYSNLTINQFKNLTIEPNLKKAISQLLAIRQPAGKQLYILPTYTAMLKIRKILNKMGLIGSSWKD